MAPLIILVASTLLAAAILWGTPQRNRRAAQWGLASMLVVTGAAHFFRTQELISMLPPLLPQALAFALVYLTGVVEFVFAALLLVRPTSQLGKALVVFLLLLLPANIYSAVAEVGLGGHGASYLWFRIPLQLLFLVWALLSTRAAVPIESKCAAP